MYSSNRLNVRALSLSILQCAKSVNALLNFWKIVLACLEQIFGETERKTSGITTTADLGLFDTHNDTELI